MPDFSGERGWVARCGGATRAATVANGLDELAARGARHDDWVLVHDAARCLRAAGLDRPPDRCLRRRPGRRPARAAAGRHAEAGARRTAWCRRRPQRQVGRADAADVPRSACCAKRSPAAGAEATDESSAIEALGHAPLLVRGELENFKLTWPADFETGGAVTEAAAMSVELRVGEGWDTHALVAGRPLVLGGVTIPHTHGLDGHSDADALLHAITDALFGAAGLGDIGRHFPDTDAAFAGADSIALLREAARRVAAAGWQIVNVDATIVAQAPKLARTCRRCASASPRLWARRGTVNVKAKTAEKMGPVGEGRAIEARAVCLLSRA